MTGLLRASGLSGQLVSKVQVLDQTDAAPVVGPHTERDEKHASNIIPPDLMRGRFGPVLHEICEKLVLGQVHGPQTNTRAASCRHEAGHAVVAAHALGEQVDLVSVKQVGRSQWNGLTHTTGRLWRISMDSSPESDIRIAWGVLAGSAAERLLDRNDYHPNTSVDELVFAKFSTMLAAAKSERDPDDLFDEVQDDVTSFLQRHASYVEPLAAVLFHKGEVTSGELARLLLRPPAHREVEFAHLSPDDGRICPRVRRAAETQPGAADSSISSMSAP